MRIEVYKDWIIKSSASDNGITLCKTGGIATRKNPKTGGTEEYEVFKSETYHKNVEQALNALCRKEIEACQATTFKGLKNEYEKLSELLEHIGEQLDKRGMVK
jgi:hypothetical protein